MRPTLLVGFLLSFATLASAAVPWSLGLSLNDGSTRRVYQGWPLIINADVALEDDVAAPVPLDLASATLTLKRKGQKEAETWPLKSVTLPDTPGALTNEQDGAGKVWLLSAEAIAAAAPGDYEATLALGEEKAPVFIFQLQPPPSPLSPEETERLHLLRGQYAWLDNHPDNALTLIEAGLATFPKSIALKLLKARILESQRNWAPALANTQAALDLWLERHGKQTHPPATILALQDRLLKQVLLNEGAAP